MGCQPTLKSSGFGKMDHKVRRGKRFRKEKLRNRYLYETIDFLFLRVFEFVDWSGDNDLETELNEDKYNEIVDNIFLNCSEKGTA